MVAALPTTLVGKRDRALLLVGFAGAFRRSELVSLECADVRFEAEGMVITLRRSKTDQESKGRNIGIPYMDNDTCPVAALKAWLEASTIERGRNFAPSTNMVKSDLAPSPTGRLP